MSTETSDRTGAATVAAEDTASDASFYRAIWRWHFYAGLLVLPFMVWLALTGGIYLFKDEINGLLYGDYRTVLPTGEATLPPSEIVARAGAALGGAAEGGAAAVAREDPEEVLGKPPGKSTKNMVMFGGNVKKC